MYVIPNQYFRLRYMRYQHTSISLSIVNKESHPLLQVSETLFIPLQIAVRSWAPAVMLSVWWYWYSNSLSWGSSISALFHRSSASDTDLAGNIIPTFTQMGILNGDYIIGYIYGRSGRQYNSYLDSNMNIKRLLYYRPQ